MIGVTLIVGMRTGYGCGNPMKLLDDCAVLKPHFFPSVPRLYNRIYAGVKAKFNELTGCKKYLIDSALASKSHYLHATQTYTHGCYDFLVFKKIKAMLGGRVKAMATGSAPIEQNVLDFLKISFCCPVLEGYGLTETCCTATISIAEDTVAGHVGGPTTAIKLRLRDAPELNYLHTDKPYPRGEIQLYGPTVTSGYYKLPEKTAEVFTEDGWFCTGDVGLVFPNGSVKIIDRVKNIFKLSQGEYIAPEKLENIYIMSPFIA
jgi:long-chain acyl-CoA synthetase